MTFIGKKVYIRLRSNGKYDTIVGKVVHCTKNIMTMPDLGNVCILTVREYDTQRDFTVVYHPAFPQHLVHTEDVSDWLRCFCKVIDELTTDDLMTMSDIAVDYKLWLCFSPSPASLTQAILSS
jgi:hypothetical protein